LPLLAMMPACGQQQSRRVGLGTDTLLLSISEINVKLADIYLTGINNKDKSMAKAVPEKLSGCRYFIG
jgi:hypothetical protein